MFDLNKYTKLITKTTVDLEVEKYIEISEKYIKTRVNTYMLFDIDLKDEIEIEQNTFKAFAFFKCLLEIDSETAIIFNFKIPYKLEFFYSIFQENKDYCIFFLEENKDLISSNLYPKSVDVAYHYMNRLLLGKFNEIADLNYEELVPYFIKIMETNEITGFQSLVYELLLQSLCREIKDSTKEFRLSATQNESSKNFKMLNVRDLPKNHSPFAALSSEGIHTGILVALKNAKTTKPTSMTPQERIALGKI